MKEIRQMMIAYITQLLGYDTRIDVYISSDLLLGMDIGRQAGG